MTQDNDLFKETPETIVVDPSKDYFPELVGEGKKYKDNTAIGRAIMEKDAFIDTLKKENAEFRERVRSSTSMDQFLDNLKKVQQVTPVAPTTPETPSSEQTVQQTKGLTLEEVQTLIDQRELAAVETRNLATAVEAVKKVYGGNYGQVMAQKAQELGVSQTFLTDVAKKTPSAFLKLVGADAPVDQNTQLFPSGSVRSSAPSTGTVTKNWAHYEKIRKEDPKGYSSTAVQLEMHQNAAKLGEAFYT